MAAAVLPVTDLDRARGWWHDVLDRDPIHTDAESENLFYDIGGTVVLVYRTDFAGTAKNTAINLVTDDLDRDVAALRARGVEFHEYDFPGLKTVDGIAQLGTLRGSWFSDSEANIFALSEPSPEIMERVMGGERAVG